MEDEISEITKLLGNRISDPAKLASLSKYLIGGATEGDELDIGFKDWLNKRFIPRLVWLEKDDYSRSLVRALWLSRRFAGTDFMSARQRDMAQVWTDTARGFLGEIAVGKYLHSKFGVETNTDTTRGQIEDYLPTDIAKVKKDGEEWREPNIKVSIKTTKFNGRWLDVPGNQYEHSDAYILVKIGIMREHFLGFLKAISFLKDKLFVEATRIGELDKQQAQELWDEVPVFEPLPAYISGFILKSETGRGIQKINAGLKGRKNKRIVIKQCVGLVSPEILRENNYLQALDPSSSYAISIEPIIDSLTNQHFFAHSGP